MIDRTPISGQRHPSWAARAKGCRCELCLRMKRRADKLRRIHGNQLTDAQPIQEMIATWVAEGFSHRAIAGAVGMSANSVRELSKRQRVWKDTAAKFAGLTRRNVIMLAPDAALVPTIGSVRRLQALVAIGHTYGDLAADTKEAHMFRAMAQGGVRSISAVRARRIIDLFDRNAMTPGPRIGNRTLANTRGYPPPLAWDDDMDDPAANPCAGSELASRHSRMLVLYRRGMNDRQIAREMSVTPDAVRYWRTRNQISPQCPTRPAVQLGEEPDARYALWQQGMGDKDIAAAVGRHPDVIRRWRGKHGLEPGNRRAG